MAQNVVGRRAGGSVDPMAVLAILLIAAIAIGLVAYRNAATRFAPGLASLYDELGLPVNVRGLDFRDISTVRDAEGGSPGLVVAGSIVNATGSDKAVPTLQFALTDGAGKDIKDWTLEPEKHSLSPGETMKFRTRLAAPPDEAKKVVVSFSTKGRMN